MSQKASSEKERAGSQTVSSLVVCGKDGEMISQWFSPGNCGSIPRGKKSRSLETKPLFVKWETLLPNVPEYVYVINWILCMNPRSEPLCDIPVACSHCLCREFLPRIVFAVTCTVSRDHQGDFSDQSIHVWIWGDLWTNRSNPFHILRYFCWLWENVEKT